MPEAEHDLAPYEVRYPVTSDGYSVSLPVVN
jgi:hypothetical protein